MSPGQSTRPPAILVEDSLGPAGGRYFAAGYREVEHELLSTTVLETTPLRTDAVAAVTYPINWSADASGKPRVPHLSSVDAIVLTILVWQRATPARFQRGWVLVAADLRAGTRPWGELAQVPVSLRAERTDTGQLVTSSVGNIRVRLRLKGSCDVFRDSSEPDAQQTVYERLYKNVRSTFFEVSLDESSGVLDAHHTVSAPPTIGRNASGLDGAQWPAVSAIDYLVTMGQLVQILIYRTVGLSRSDIDNLWMRSMSLHFADEPARLPITYATQTSVVRDRVIKRGGGCVHDVLVQSFASTGVVGTAALAYSERVR